MSRQPLKLTLALGVAALLAGPALADGKGVFEAQKCTMCHTIQSQGIGQASADSKKKDLSDVGARHDAAWISDYLQKKVEQNGAPHKKAWAGTDADLKEITSWLASLKEPAK